MTNDECMTDTYVYACMSDVDLSRTRYIDAFRRGALARRTAHLIKPPWVFRLGPGAADAVRAPLVRGVGAFGSVDHFAWRQANSPHLTAVWSSALRVQGLPGGTPVRSASTWLSISLRYTARWDLNAMYHTKKGIFSCDMNDMKSMFAEIVARQGEGIMLRKNLPFKEGRSSNLLKYKKQMTGWGKARHPMQCVLSNHWE